MWTCWIIWMKRCNTVFEQVMLNPNVAAEEAKYLFEEYKKLPKNTAETTRTPTKIRWQRQEPGATKINCDAAGANKQRGADSGLWQETWKANSSEEQTTGHPDKVSNILRPMQ